jgi:hypothetical protein
MDMAVCGMKEELWQEDIWDKLNRGIYIEYQGCVIDYETGEIICKIQQIQPD